MRLAITDIKKLMDNGIINTTRLGNSKGSTVVIYKGKSFYVWKENNRMLFQKKWPWSTKYIFSIDELQE